MAKKLKRLFSDTGDERYRNLHLKEKCPANLLNDETIKVCGPILLKWSKAGYSLRDVVDIMQHSIEYQAVWIRLGVPQKPKKKKGKTK